MLEPKIHYLRDNHRESSPHKLLIFDSETRDHEAERGHVQSLRLWCAETVSRVPGIPESETIAKHKGHTADELVQLIELASKGDHTLWIYAHNLNFDLTVTRLPVRLIEAGWELTQHALFTDSPWARFRKKSRRIVIVDSFSVCPTSVEQLGIVSGIAKPDLPGNDDSDEAWFHRCDRDVEIVRHCILACMNWWDENHLGNWTITGASIGWSSFRHMDRPVKVTINPDADARKFERDGLMGGRREVWRTGLQPQGYYLDLDFQHAHLTVAAEEKLPYRRMKGFDSLPAETPYLDMMAYDIMAEAEIRTTVPRYPVRRRGGIFYPVGHFKTILAGPELREARRRGELVSIGKGYVYQVAHVMRPWALWLAELMDQDDPDVHPAVMVMTKGWSRTVPGKWATRTSEEVGEFPDPRPGWRIEEGWIMPGFKPAVYVTIGGKQQIYARDQEADDSFPAVLAFIQSYTRVYLGRLIDTLGEAVCQTNTDGVLVDLLKWAKTYSGENRPESDEDGHLLAWADARLEEVNRQVTPLNVRIKRISQHVEILSPQHVILDDENRLSGIPRKSEKVGKHKYRFTVWPKLPYQLQKGSEKGYVQHGRTVDLSNVPVNRWMMLDGTCREVHARIDENGNTEFMQAHIQDEYYQGLAPAKRQHRELAKLMEDGKNEERTANDSGTM